MTLKKEGQEGKARRRCGLSLAEAGRSTCHRLRRVLAPEGGVCHSANCSLERACPDSSILLQLHVPGQCSPVSRRLRMGVSTAAYQIEGGVNEGGRGDSVWDAFSRTPGKTVNGDTGEVACDHFHRYKEDIQIMKSLGLKHYRFSIAWPRIIPAGVGEVNEEGVAFYNDLINELIANDIEPLATLFHWDLPLALQTEFDGWRGGKPTIDAFVAFARVCFKSFGDRVKRWLTLDEPWIISVFGYAWGTMAPGASITRTRRHTRCRTTCYSPTPASSTCTDPSSSRRRAGALARPS